MSVFQTCLTFVWPLPCNFTMDYIASSDKCLTFHNCISHTLNTMNVDGWFSAAEIRSRPMNPPGNPRSYHRWSVWRPMDSLGFAENVLELKWRDDSTDALISNVRCVLVKCGPRLIYFDHFWLVAWSQQITDWRTTQNSDGPPNHQP